MNSGNFVITGFAQDEILQTLNSGRDIGQFLVNDQLFMLRNGQIRYATVDELDEQVFQFITSEMARRPDFRQQLARLVAPELAELLQPRQLVNRSFVGINADVASTILGTVPATGLYRVNVYATTTNADAGAGLVAVELDFTDQAGARLKACPSLNLSGLGSANTFNITATFFIRCIAGTTWSFQAVNTGAYNTATYDLFFVVTSA